MCVTWHMTSWPIYLPLDEREQNLHLQHERGVYIGVDPPATGDQCTLQILIWLCLFFLWVKCCFNQPVFCVWSLPWWLQKHRRWGDHACGFLIWSLAVLWSLFSMWWGSLLGIGSWIFLLNSHTVSDISGLTQLGRPVLDLLIWIIILCCL